MARKAIPAAIATVSLAAVAAAYAASGPLLLGPASRSRRRAS